MSNRILFGHLLGGGFRHSSKGSTFLFGGESDMHLRDGCIWRLLKVLGRKARRGA